MTNYLKDSVSEIIRARHQNRPAVGRELLALLGSELQLDPATLLRMKDGVQDDWTLSGGATFEAATNQGTVEMSASVVKLSGQNHKATTPITGLPLGAYYLRVWGYASAAVAADLGVKVRNVTDSADVLAELTKQANLTPYGLVLEVPFSIRAADAVTDVVQVELIKKTATANTIRIDRVTIHPVDARHQPWGETPDGGRSVPAYNANGTVATITIYDATASGNVVETATFAYNADGTLNTITRVRGARTRTTTYSYTGGNVNSIQHVVT